jgi:hypothetical protein
MREAQVTFKTAGEIMPVRIKVKRFGTLLRNLCKPQQARISGFRGLTAGGLQALPQKLATFHRL